MDISHDGRALRPALDRYMPDHTKVPRSVSLPAISGQNARIPRAKSDIRLMSDFACCELNKIVAS